MQHLHCHSTFSLLDGLGSPEQLAAKAKSIGASALAVTDHASISCLFDLFKAAEKHGIKPIPGCEFYVVDNAEPTKGEKRYHLVAWAKSWAGVQSIMQTLNIANQQYYMRPRITWEQALELSDCMISTACCDGLLSHPDWESLVARFVTKFGPDFFVEIMPHKILNRQGEDIQRPVNERALILHMEQGIPLVATNDAHFVEQKDVITHEILLAIQTGKKWTDPKRWKFGDVFFMRTEEEMIDAFNDAGINSLVARKAIAGCQAVVDRSNVVLPDFNVALPKPIPGDELDALKAKIIKGYKAKIVDKGLDSPQYRERMLTELEVVKRLGFERYFLIVEDVISWAKAQGIMVGPARGSAAGSLLCYLIGITAVDPLKFGLFFERFLNEERISMPDIDCDFQQDRRQEVFDYLQGKYGEKHTAHISTYGVLTMKSAFRDVARVFGIQPLTIDSLSHHIEDEESFSTVPELIKFGMSPGHGMVVEHAKKLVGKIRQIGVHACGVVLSSKPMAEVGVIEKRRDEFAINWDMRECEQSGLLKIDILGLNTLNILAMARDLIRKRHGTYIDFDTIPLDDEATLEAFARGDTVGIFQFESSGMMGLLRAIAPKDFLTVAAITALYRPGSLGSGQTALFVKIAKGDEYEAYVTPELRPILEETHGILVYQEQIMRIFNELAGMSWTQADTMRKIIGKKLGKEEFEKHREAFVEGCQKTVGLEATLADRLFTQMVEFANYSFNKSHSCAYTLISYWSQYLKTHYPIEFLTAFLSYADENKRPAILRDVMRRGIEIELPDINYSEATFAIHGDKIVAPLSMIKGLGDKTIEDILAARAATGVNAFSSWEDFQNRITKKITNKARQECLINAGAAQSLGMVVKDPEQRAKHYAELLPQIQGLPSLEPVTNRLDKALFDVFVSQIAGCAGVNQWVPPWTKTKPIVMVINRPVKNEERHFTSNGSKYFLAEAKKMGFNPGCFYYTAPIKCVYEYGKTPPACQVNCLEHLKREIIMVKPQVILCLTREGAGLFTKERFADMHGQFLYSSQFDAWVLFGPSPQSAYFKEENQPAFLEVLQRLKDIFS